MKMQMKSRSWFLVGMLSAATVGAFANIPNSGSTSGTMAPTQDVSEIRAKHQADLSFDQDLKRLNAVKGRYHENLPLMKHKAPAKKLASPRVRARVGQR
jgi:photosystem II stability/assembly factor-like uncharacterized protein